MTYKTQPEQIAELMAEADRLRAENERLEAEISRWDETDPIVNKRLKDDLHEILTLRAENERLRAENGRLKEKLTTQEWVNALKKL